MSIKKTKSFKILLLIFLSGILVMKQGFSQIRVVYISGSDTQKMGFQYGQKLAFRLQRTLKTLETFYIARMHVSYHDLFVQANLLFNRFPRRWQKFIQGEASGANISISDAVILNGMETLSSLGQCAFISIPGKMTQSGDPLIARNYDYPRPFDKIAQDLLVTVLKMPRSMAVAIIGLPGEIYCPSCLNEKGVFMELNNGMPSGGFEVNNKAPSMLSDMLDIMLQSDSSMEAQRALERTHHFDFSLIVNIADAHQTYSNELSTMLGQHALHPNNLFVSTNYFLSQDWSGVQKVVKPTDKNSWLGVSRREHLLHQISKASAVSKGLSASSSLNVQVLEHIMNMSFLKGGAKVKHTIYQIIYAPKTQDLYLHTKGAVKWHLFHMDAMG